MAFAFVTPITIDHTKCGAADSTNFAVGIIDNSGLARLKSVGNGGHVQSSSGFDIRWYSDLGLTTALTYELVFYDPVTGKIETWVKVPTLSHTVDTVIYMAYGDATITTDGSSPTTWDSNYKLVSHLPNGSALTASDSSQSANTVVTNGTVSAVAGQIDGGASFNGTSTNNIAVATFPFSAVFSLSAWANVGTTNDVYQSVVSRGSVFENNTNFSLSLRFSVAASNYRLACYYRNGSTLAGAETILAASPVGAMHYIGASLDSSKVMKLYYDNALISTSAALAVAPGNGSQGLYIARPNTVTGTDFAFTGTIDDVRVSHALRADAWFTAEYNNGASPATFYTVGTEQAAGTVSPLRYNSLLNGLGASGPFFRNPLG